MSRCFPYPPPGYSRNGATYEALIESIKLQKENDKAKAERRKEKRAKKEKKDKKEKRKTEEKAKPQPQSQQDSHKQLQTSTDFKEQKSLQNLKRLEPTIEHLEKSDVTEEHGQPVDSHKPSYSSDSTQNSNKRKREDPVVPDDDSNHATPIFKIRLLKKQKGHDLVQETSRRSEQQNLSTSENIVSNSLNGHIKGDRSNRRNIVPPVTSARENMSVDDPQVRKQPTSISGRQIVPPVPPQLKKSDVAVLNSSRQQQPITSHRRHSENKLPTPSQIVPPVPSVSGREIKAPKVGPTRIEKKLNKKHLKYEKLIGSWVPPVLEVSTDDDDWLSGSGKKGSARSAVGDDVETCREMMWQPCARFLVEGDVYAMPYTVPF